MIYHLPSIIFIISILSFCFPDFTNGNIYRYSAHGRIPNICCIPNKSEVGITEIVNINDIFIFFYRLSNTNIKYNFYFLYFYFKFLFS